MITAHCYLYVMALLVINASCEFLKTVFFSLKIMLLFSIPARKFGLNVVFNLKNKDYHEKLAQYVSY